MGPVSSPVGLPVPLVSGAPWSLDQLIFSLYEFQLISFPHMLTGLFLQHDTLTLMQSSLHATCLVSQRSRSRDGHSWEQRCPRRPLFRSSRPFRAWRRQHVADRPGGSLWQPDGCCCFQIGLRTSWSGVDQAIDQLRVAVNRTD